MISWIKGERIENWSHGSKHGVLVSCSGIGYEIQLSKRNEIKLQNIEVITLWIHQVQKDDGYSLFGFTERKDRDLFRIIIGVNGIGPQIGLALLEKFETAQLIKILANKDIDTLTIAQGVGKRTAERLFVELKDKLNQFLEETEQNGKSQIQRKSLFKSSSPELDDLRLTLSSLEYEKDEIDNSLAALELQDNPPNIGQSSNEALANDQIDVLLKSCLLWLNKEKS